MRVDVAPPGGDLRRQVGERLMMGMENSVSLAAGRRSDPSALTNRSAARRSTGRYHPGQRRSSSMRLGRTGAARVWTAPPDARVKTAASRRNDRQRDAISQQRGK